MNDDVLDLKEFLERVQDDKELLLELLDIFQQDFQDKRVLLNTAIESNDYEQIKSIAHSLKGASGNISAKALRATMLSFEEIVRAKNLTEARNVFHKMDGQFEALKNRIQILKKEL